MIRNLRHLTACSVFVLGSGLAFAAPVVNVPTDQGSITAAMGVVDPGGEIVVDASAYATESNEVTINKNVTIRAINGKTTIQAASAFLGAVHIESGASDVTLENLIVTNSDYHGVFVEVGTSLTLNNCNIDGSGNAGPHSGLWVADIGAGTFTLNANNTTFNNNFHRGWTLDFDGNYILNADGSQINGNGELGILIGAAGTLTMDFLDTTVDGNGALAPNNSNGALILKGSGTFENCSFSNNTNWGADFTGPATAGRTYVFTNCTFTGNRNRDSNDGGGVILFATADYTLNNCTIDDNHRGVLLFSKNDEVPPSSGTFIKSTATINGGSISDNTTVGLQPDGGVGGLELDITGLAANGNGEFGIGIFSQGTYTIADSEISNNSFHGIRRIFNPVIGQSTVIDVTNTTFANNGGWGLWVEGQAADVILADCTFDSNAATIVSEGNLFMDGDEAKTLTADRTLFKRGSSEKDNIALFGAITATLTNCIIEDGGPVEVGAESLVGGIKALSGAFADTFGPADVTLRHCTIVAQGSSANRNGITVELTDGANNATVTAENTIIDGFGIGVRLVDSGGAGVPGYSGNHNLTNNTTDYDGGATAGTNPQTGDPLFTDRPNGDYTLSALSPAVDNGADLGITTDFTGDPGVRPQGPAPDIGAFEYVEATSVDTWMMF